MSERDPICPECGFPQSEWATFCQHNFGSLQAYVAEYVNDSPAALRARLTEAQSNALEMARKAEQAERRAEEAEFHVEQLRDALDSAERSAERIEARAVELATERDAALCRIARAERLIDSWEHDAPDHSNPVFVGRLRERLRRDPAPVRLRGDEKEPLSCNAEGIPHSAHDWDFGSGEMFRCAGTPGCDDECTGLCGEHHWLDRPESDSRECLICGTEVAG